MTPTAPPHPVRRLTPGLAPRPLWLRIVAPLGGILLLLVAWVILGIFSVPSAEGGWWPTALGLLPALLVLLLGTGIGRHWWTSALVAAGIALLLGAWAYDTAPPDPARLAAVARDVGVPEGWTTISAEPGGSTWGLFGDWPHFYAVYATTATPAEAVADLTARLRAEGWEHDAPTSTWADQHSVTHQAWHQGRWHVQFDVSGPATSGHRFVTDVPADQTRVALYYR